MVQGSRARIEELIILMKANNGQQGLPTKDAIEGMGGN